MLDGWYANITKKIDYRKLAMVTPILTIIMVFVILTNGLVYGIEFMGGTWMDVLTDRELTPAQLTSLKGDFESVGLNDVKVSVGYDINTNHNKLTVQTTSVFEDKETVAKVLSPYVGELTEFDTARVNLDSNPPASLSDNLVKRLRYGVDVTYEDGVLELVSLNLEQEELESALSYYLGKDVKVDLLKKNFNLRSVGPTLGDTFRTQGITALFISFFFMSIVVYFAFKMEIVPAIAVIQAAVCDMIIALGGMSLFGIPLEPATIAALLMLIGYSVDTDIMLTSRTIKDRRGNFDEQVEDALKTGLTMTGTTLAVLMVIFIMSTTLTQISTWANISAVLIIGLFGDLPATWFTNVGILKWYTEKKNSGGFAK